MPQSIQTYHPHRTDHGYYQSWRDIQHRRSLSARVGRAWHRLVALAYRLALWLMLAALVAAAVAVGGR